MSTITYQPEGKSHWVLEQLEFGPMARADLLDLAAITGHERIRYVISGLLADGLIRHACNRDEITDAGRDALETLRDGHFVFRDRADVPVIRTSVRVFERRAA